VNTEPIACMFERMPPEKPTKKPGGKKPGRPRKLAHPIAVWIEEHYAGDRDRLAAEAEISRSHLDGVLSGTQRLSFEAAWKISEITGIDREILRPKP
jgi:AraC-like DNA-binding protein